MVVNSSKHAAQALHIESGDDVSLDSAKLCSCLSQNKRSGIFSHLQAFSTRQITGRKSQNVVCPFRVVNSSCADLKFE